MKNWVFGNATGTVVVVKGGWLMVWGGEGLLLQWMRGSFGNWETIVVGVLYGSLSWSNWEVVGRCMKII